MELAEFGVSIHVDIMSVIIFIIDSESDSTVHEDERTEVPSDILEEGPVTCILDDGDPKPSSAQGNRGNSCQCPCCELVLHQPSDQKTLDKSIKIYGKGSILKKRSFQTDWYKLHPWLSLCSSKGKAFCSICMTAKANDLFTFSTKMDNAFIFAGFDNWKKASTRFKEHENSGTHV